MNSCKQRKSLWPFQGDLASLAKLYMPITRRTQPPQLPYIAKAAPRTHARRACPTKTNQPTNGGGGDPADEPAGVGRTTSCLRSSSARLSSVAFYSDPPRRRCQRERIRRTRTSTADSIQFPVPAAPAFLSFSKKEAAVIVPVCVYEYLCKSLISTSKLYYYVQQITRCIYIIMTSLLSRPFRGHHRSCPWLDATRTRPGVNARIAVHTSPFRSRPRSLR